MSTLVPPHEAAKEGSLVCPCLHATVCSSLGCSDMGTCRGREPLLHVKDVSLLHLGAVL